MLDTALEVELQAVQRRIDHRPCPFCSPGKSFRGIAGARGVQLATGDSRSAMRETSTGLAHPPMIRHMPSGLDRSTTLALGRFLFRFRAIATLLLLAACVLISQPRDLLDLESLDLWMDLAGAFVVLLGLGVRALAVGALCVGEGGENALVQEGIYAHTRHPMILGNSLVFLGLAMVLNAPQFYLIGLPLAALGYAAIIVAEEDCLHARFGAEFEAYRARVDRVVPRLRSLVHAVPAMRFPWRRVVAADSTAIFLAVAGIIVFDWLHDRGVSGSLSLTSPDHAPMVAFLAAWGIAFAIVRRLDKAQAFHE